MNKIGIYAICTKTTEIFLKNFVKIFEKVSKKLLQIDYKTVTIQTVAKTKVKIYYIRRF